MVVCSSQLCLAAALGQELRWAPRRNQVYADTMQLSSCMISLSTLALTSCCTWLQFKAAHLCSGCVRPDWSGCWLTMCEQAEVTAGIGQGMGQPGGMRPGMQPGPSGPMGGQAQGQAGQSMGMRPSFSGGLPPGQTANDVWSLAMTSTSIMACCNHQSELQPIVAPAPPLIQAVPSMAAQTISTNEVLYQTFHLAGLCSWEGFVMNKDREL